MKHWLIPLIAILAVAAIAGAGYLGTRRAAVTENDVLQEPLTVAVTRGDVQQAVTAPGQLLGTREVLLGMRIGGHLSDIHVQPGSVVKAGEALIQVEPEPLVEAVEQARLRLARAETEHAYQLAGAELAQQIAEAQLERAKARHPNVATAEAQLAAAQAELQDLLAGPTEDELTVAAAAVRQSQIALKQAQWDYDAVAYADNIGALPEAARLEEATLDYEAKLADYKLATAGPTEAEIAEAEARVQQAQAEFEAARAEIKVDQQEIAILEAELERAQLDLAWLQTGVDPLLARALEEAEQDLANTTLTAPFDSVVLEVLATPGDYVSPETGLIRLADPTAAEVQTTVIEEDLPLVQVGQPVDLFFDAHSGEAVEGYVSRIVPRRIQGEDRPLYHVYISPTQLPEGVVSGMTADASIIIDQRSDVLRLPRALVQANSQGSARIEVWVNGEIEERTVKLGLRGDVYVEIVEGLREGDQIVGE